MTSAGSCPPKELAAELGPFLRAEAAANEANRNLTDATVAALRDRDLFRFWVPKVYGGAEATVADGVDAFVELARHDGATAWVAFIANTTALLAAVVDDEHAKDIWGRPDALTGGFAQPKGRARVVDGGLSVTGRWQWGSGTQHATAVGGGALVVDADGKPTKRADGLAVPFVFFDPADVTFLDTWHTVGLRGSGSTDYEVTEAFVPEGRWAAGLGQREVRLDGPLYRFSFYGLLATGIAATAIGLLDRAIEEFVDLAGAKKPQNSSRTLAERATAQIELARAEATLASARAFFDDSLGRAWDIAVAGDPIDDETKRMIRLANTDATQRCATAIDGIYRAAGGEAVFDRNPIGRMFRDANVATQHAMCAERIYELCGRMGIGLTTDTRML